MTGGKLTLGALLARPGEQERDIAAAAGAARERIAELTELLDEFDKAAEEIRITRKTLLELPDPTSPAPPAAKLPDHPAYQQIMAEFAAPRCGRGRCARRWTSRSRPTTSTTSA